MQGVVATTSPSMDIQISSNFERLFFFAHGRNSAKVRAAMDGLRQSRAFTIDDAALTAIRRDFSAGRADQAAVDAVIRETAEESGCVLDPHSAIAVDVGRRFERISAPMVALATAHPAKFPAAVKAACGIDPALPSWLSDLMNRDEHFDILPADLDAIEAHIEANARAAG
jgi:threonine synthase